MKNDKNKNMLAMVQSRIVSEPGIFSERFDQANEAREHETSGKSMLEETIEMGRVLFPAPLK